MTSSMTSMKGKRVIITGPTSGVGKEIALQVAALGAELILGCRGLKKGTETAAEITRRTGSSKLVVMQIDTSSQKSIREFARDFRRKYRRLDVLINNAAGNRGTLPRVTSVDGIELTFATNVLGYFLLTQELLDVLKKNAPARIINVASVAGIGTQGSSIAYCASKAAVIHLTRCVAMQLGEQYVRVNSISPGGIAFVNRASNFMGTPGPEESSSSR